MSRKTFEEKIEEMVAEEQAAATEQQVEETPSEDTPAEEQPTGTVSENDTEPPVEVQADPEPDPKPDQEEHKTEAIDEIENANSIIRRRLEKQAKKFEEEKTKMKADWDSSFEERVKAAVEEELKKRTEKPKLKTRDEFQYDEDYIKYLNEQNVNEILDARERQKAEKDAAEAAEAEKKKAEADAAEEVIKQRQKLFLSNVDECFEGNDKAVFMAQVQYATKKGLGDLLDSCPVASDYLLNSRKGPKVLSKILNDRDAFLRVFDPKGISPMEQYYELKELEKSLESESKVVATKEPPAATAPKLGKPGAQGGSSSVNVMDDPKARRDEMRRIMGY